jgi:cytochrome c oxidase subunit IV
MNNLIKIAFVVQIGIAITSLIHNFWGRFNLNFMVFLLYACMVVGVFLTWKIFDKKLSFNVRITAFLIGTIPLLCLIVFLFVVSSLH